MAPAPAIHWQSEDDNGNGNDNETEPGGATKTITITGKKTKRSQGSYEDEGRNVSSPAIIVELKYGNAAQAAIDQIKQKQYPQKVGEYANRLLLVGISYDKATKKRECSIERMQKS